MSGANPVETKPEAPKADEASALATPTAPTPPAAAKAGWWAGLGGKKKIGLMVGGSVLALAGAGYGYKHLNPSPPKAVAQGDPAPEVQPKPDEPARISPAISDVPDIKVPAVPEPRLAPAPKIKPAGGPDPDLVLPDIQVPTVPALKPPPIPTIGIDPPPIKPVVPDIEPPPIIAPDLKPKPDADPPLIVAPDLKPRPMPKPSADPDPLPPIPTIDLPDLPKPKAKTDTSFGTSGNDIKAPTPDTAVPTLTIPTLKPVKKDVKPAGDPDPFIAPAPIPATGPAPLPTDVTDKKEKPKDAGPVIRSGGQDVVAPPTMPMVPAVPTLDVVPPPMAPAPMPKMMDPLVIPPPPMPKPGDPPVPVIDLPPMKDKPAPMAPAITVPTIMAPGIEGPPAVGVPKPESKKDMYDEDWHPQRDGDTYVLISKEYYKTADYAQALEAYNKDRRKPGERIIRVPPTWVLEEQFPNLVKADKPESPSSPEPKEAGVKFEPAGPSPGTGRPAPPPAATGNDEYKVTAEAGETIREIARKALGNPESWKKLWDLNPGLDPTRPIPLGTTLRLPR